MDFIKEGNGISTTFTGTKHFDYKELLTVRDNLLIKLADNEQLIAECIRLKVELPKEEVIV